MKRSAPKGFFKKGTYRYSLQISHSLKDEIKTVSGSSIAELVRLRIEYSLEEGETVPYPYEDEEKETNLYVHLDPDTWQEVQEAYKKAPDRITTFAQFMRELIWNGVNEI